MTEFIPPGTRWIDLPSPFPMKRGGELQGARIAYETWGTLNAARDNAVLVAPGLSPNAHMAANSANPDAGWWEPMVGPGKPIDTDRWYVVCTNPLGSCKGSTGPASIDPATGTPYRFSFPELSIEDGADAIAHVVRELGIGQLACLVGNSMGGMVALAMLIRHPGIARTHINISGAARALPWSIAIRSLQREAIRLDPNFNGGDYNDEHYPESGMRMARKLGVITYRSALEWDGRFGRVRLDSDRSDDEPFGLEFQVESYLEAHARRFVRQYDPNCYLYLSRSMDWFDLGDHCAQRGTDSRAHTRAGLAAIHIERALAIGAETDILFPLQQQQEIADGLREGGADAQCLPMPSPQGHDAFLVDFDRYGPAVRGFLDTL
ncbi:homoserine acetyltransferase [Lysobacter concretionis Ko07 = DSM 16239]|uniref:Serine O-succinyltransferase n=1 Tax=Lysobacter concretionis Ko07 = DSM 16239 TaxID=1122185 RepID=A0A0A0EN92_9GAMM|nr:MULTISPECIES: homoserine O-acetyltransferase [Lysobacter]KGM51730.1 homoserine acetyltransferase [Lysobacter concretionis Ko07 = DSM 16239]QOD92200.1 homoserine O-acetyltransferase [Lysobacter sp. CW239]